MATPYSDIYSYFLIKVTDYSFVNYTQTELEEMLEPYLLIACTKFSQCSFDLSKRDDVSKSFESDLKDIDKEILATLMSIEYLKPSIITTDIIHQSLNDKDIRQHSQAIHLRELKSLYYAMRRESEKLISDYTFQEGNMDDLE